MTVEQKIDTKGADTVSYRGQYQSARLTGITYTIERSNLATLNSDFPPIGGKSFSEWIDYYATGGEFLEIGGGREQVAARELLGRRSDISFVAFEPRELLPEVEREVTKFPKYRFIKGETSQINEYLNDEKFDIIFAHRVFEHTEVPLLSIQQASNVLKPRGILFCDSVPMGMETSREFINQLRRTGTKAAAIETYPESSWLKAGIVRMNLAIKRGDEFVFPAFKVGDYLNDYYGKKLSFRHCYLD